MTVPKAAGLPSGTLYPMLARLEDQKPVTSAWETPQATARAARMLWSAADTLRDAALFRPASIWHSITRPSVLGAQAGRVPAR
jgi:hypothetical protein